MYRLDGKTVVITGATSGIGLKAAKKFAQAGAFVVGVGRLRARNQAAKMEIQSTIPDANIEFLLAELALQVNVHSLIDAIILLFEKNHYRQLDVLINNAGLYLEQKNLTLDGIEKTFAVNHLAPFLLTHGLMPLLGKASFGRVLTVSSYSHRTTPLCLQRIVDPWPYIGLLAYKRSKLCNVLFTYEFNRRYDNVTAFAVDPGLVNTGIASKGSQGISHWVWRRRRHKGTSPEIPVESLLYLSAEEQINVDQGYYFKDSQYKNPSRKSRDPRIARKLWALSCKITGVNW